MSETLTLPVLPLDDEVVLPGMVVPLETSQPEVGAAIDAARMPSRQVPGMRSEIKAQVLLVPRLADRGLAGVGTLAVVEQVGRLPGGQPGAVVRGTARVRIGSGTTGPGAALWVQGTVVEDTGRGPRADELAQQYKSLVTGILQQRGAWQVIDAIQQLDDASAIADRVGYANYLTTAQKLQVLETADLVERLELIIGWTKEHLAELEVAESIRKDVSEGMEKQQKEFLLRQQLAAVRKELADLNGDSATEEDDYRARVEAADLPEAVREAALKEVDKLERTPDASPETGWIRTWLDTVLDIPVERADRGRLRHRRRAADPGRGPHRARRRQGAHHRVPGGAQAPRRPGPGDHRRAAFRRRARAGRPARRRQDVARRIGRAGHGPQVRPGLPGRRPGRGGDPRAPAYLRRGAARPDRPRHPRGGLDEPGRAARRGGQDRLGLPRRPRLGPARGARPGAEPHVPRPLPRGRARPVRRGLPGHGQRARHDPRTAARPDGAGPARRVHRGREGPHRPGSPAAQAAVQGRA